jgi:hypothetical protein
LTASWYKSLAGIGLDLHFYGNRGIAAKGIDDFDAGDVFARCGIGVGGIADGFEAAVFAGAVVLPVVGEGFARLPVKIYCPEVDEIKAAADGAIADGFQFFAGDFGEGGQELGEFDINGGKTLTPSPSPRGREGSRTVLSPFSRLGRRAEVLNDSNFLKKEAPDLVKWELSNQK